MSYLFTIVGFVLLFSGGELLVRGAVAVARRFRLSPMLIGLTVVAFATSAPELLVSLQSALRAQPDIAVGNAVGSSICNIAVVLGFAAMVKPIASDPVDIRRDVYMMLAASVGVLVLGFLGEIGRGTGIFMVLVLVGFIAYSYRQEIKAGTEKQDWHAEETEVYSDVRPKVLTGLVLTAIGLALLIAGAQLLITGASEIARGFGVPEWAVGVTIVAIGTSLPELATSAIAALRGHPDVAVGNVVGSNTFNLLLILGFTAAIRPISFSDRLGSVDIPIMLGFTAVASIAMLTTGKIGRLMGALMAAAYIVYLVLVYSS